MKKKVAFYTLGCKVNFCETESLQTLFEEAGFKVTDFKDQADVYIVNTCTVTAASDHKSRKAIRQAGRRSPHALIVATGCYAQGAPEEVGETGLVDLVIGNRDRNNLPQLVRSLQKGSNLNLVSAHRTGDSYELLPAAGKRRRTRGFLKIQEGCNQACSYCIVPRVRGPLRSLPPGEALAGAAKLVASGCREIVLTGVHLGLYGADLEGVGLVMLLQQLEELPGLVRIRISSLEPSDITAELVEQIVLSKRICPHLHIPLQSGDDEILQLMNRPYAPVEYLYLAKWLKQEIPGLALGTDIIVGFPGETERHHRRSMKLISDIGFSSLHVFKYSPRPLTRAADLPGRPPAPVRELRSREMIALGDQMASAYRRSFRGTTQPVLIEKVVPYHYAEGFSPHYLRVRVKCGIKGLHWRGRLINALLEREDGSLVLASKSK